MSTRLDGLKAAVARLAPEGTPRRKLLQLVAIILVVEGLSVLALFSYAWIGLGVASIVIGAAILLLMYPGAGKPAEVEESPGIRFIDAAIRTIGGGYVAMVLGAAIISLVLLYNLTSSERPDIGDLDSITILFGALLVAYPLLSSKYKTEVGFSLLFVGFVVLFLVVPQAVTALSDGTGSSSIGNWYVHYMLAAPFAGILDLTGIPASSSGSMVTMEFKDGTVQMLSISAYCAGLYSFSIFLSAFLSFVLVYERMSRRMLFAVLGLGLLVAYLGNLFRMVVIGVVGYHYGIDALLWAHENVGWMVFLAWSAAFWWVILRWVSAHKESGKPVVEAN